MAASVPSDKVRDKEYTNWLKVTLALYYMKSGLHAFIQSEVNCLHQSLVQTIYGGQTVPLPPCTMCHANLVKRNKYTGTWEFRNQCGSYCDVWLYELLVLHTNPKSEQIYWDNTDVSSWPFSPWQCAKVFMPRGQLPSSTGPAECDAQALLTLLSNCKHFQRKLSRSGQSLTHTVSAIRNKVMHNGEMKLSDTERKDYIQQIIQLLEDPVSLKSTEDCKAAVGNINKIDNDPVDVFFNVGLEIIAMREAVNELRRELGNQGKGTTETVDKLKEEYEQLREQVRKRFEDVEKELILHENRMDTIEKDIKSVQEKTDTALQQHEKKLQEMHTTVTSEQKQFEVVKTKMETIARDVQLVKEETESVLQQQDKKCQEMNTTFTQLTETLYKRVASQDVKMDTIVRDVQSVKGERESLLQQQETNTQMTEILYKRVASQDVRLLAVEENVSKLQLGQRTEKKKSCRKDTNAQKRRLTSDKDGPAPKRILSKKQGTNAQKRRLQDDKDGPATKRLLSKREDIDSAETSPKRRPETDGLKQLKSRTENKLDTVRRLKCIPITQAEKAKKLLEEERSVVIKGNPGEGKTTTALNLIDNEIYSDRRVVLYFPRDWEAVDTDWVNIIVVEDIFGQYDLDLDRLKEWMVHLPTIQEHVDAGKLQVIITTRVDILSKAYSMLGSLKLFSSDLSLMLSSNKLEMSEKISILNRELQRHERNMEEEGKKKCIDNFSGLIGFPQCCALFAGDNNLFGTGSKFFKSPEKYFVVNITKLEDTRFLSLAFLFCSGKISEQELSPETIPESSKCLLTELAKCLNISEQKTSITLLRDIYEVFVGLYVVKSISRTGHPCIEFSHATVYEAVGHTLGNRCPEMIIKHGTPEYLYQRTYTALAKEISNVFLPVSVYSLLAKRMVCDVVKNKLVKSVVKHSAFKQDVFVEKLEEELCKQVNETEKFLMDSSCNQTFDSLHGLSEINCTTFLQCILQVDADAVRLVYNKFLKFLTCEHMKTPYSCQKCKEKQKLLEIALYYHHFEITDKLINMNACYTPLCLCNAARHNDLRRVQTILESLKMNNTFSSKSEESKIALCNAYISGNRNLQDLLLKEEIALEGKHVTYIVKHGNMNSLLDAVEHLKFHNKWIPSWDEEISNNSSHYFPFSTALYFAYANEKLDMADYLVKNGVKVSMYMLKNVLRYSQQTLETLIQHLKDADAWDPKCDVASKALENVYNEQKDDMCRLLIHEGVSLRMACLPRLMFAFHKVTQHLKDTGNWDPKCDDASEALEQAFCTQRYDVCELLIHDGVSLTMKNLPGVTNKGSLEIAQKAIQHLRERGEWNPMCDVASEALEKALCEGTFDMCELLIQNRVSLTMKNLLNVKVEWESPETVEKVIQYLKETGNWNPKCDYASEALVHAFLQPRECDWIDLLTENGVSLTMDSIHHLNIYDFDDGIGFYERVFEDIVEHLIDTGNWNPECDAASEALEKAFKCGLYGVCDLLINNGVSIRMNKVSCVLYIPYFGDDIEIDFYQVETTERAIQQLKDTGNWNPKCDDASEALEEAFKSGHYRVCDLLINNGVSIRMNKVSCVLYIPYFDDYIDWSHVETTKRAIQQLKDTGNWNPECDAASEALEKAFKLKRYDLCNLLIDNGVSVRMDKLDCVVYDDDTDSDEDEEDIDITETTNMIKKAVQQLKDTGNWNPICDAACEALEEAFMIGRYDLCNLLIDNGVSVRMDKLDCVVYDDDTDSDEDEEDIDITETTNMIKKAVQQLKDNGNWNPNCDAAYKVLLEGFWQENYDVCDLLIQDGVPIPLMYLPVISKLSSESAMKVIRHLKDSGSCYTKCYAASQALENAYREHNYDICDLLIQEGVSLRMKNLPCFMQKVSLETAEKVIEHLKYTGKWDPKCDDASEALENAFYTESLDMCELLILNEVSLTMKNLIGVIKATEVSLVTILKAIQNLQLNGNWNPKCDDASEALKNAFCNKNYDVCELLISNGVSLTMKTLVGIMNQSLDSHMHMKAIQHLKNTSNWNPTCDNAPEALKISFCKQEFDVCDLLMQSGVSLTMKNLPYVIKINNVSLATIERAIQNLKDTGIWNPKCDLASEALVYVFCEQKYDVCKLLIQEGVVLTMNNLPGVVNNVLSWRIGFDRERDTSWTDSVMKAVIHLKDTGNWNPKCDAASEVLVKAFNWHSYVLCNLLMNEGVPLTMKNMPSICTESATAVKAIQHIKDTGNWNPKCDYASESLERIFGQTYMYHERDLLIQYGISLTMKNLSGGVKGSWKLKDFEKAIQHLKDNGNWDPKCDYASVALEQAFSQEKLDVCELLILDGVSLTMKNLPGIIKANNVSSETVEKVIQHLKDTDNWDPKSNDALEALKIAVCKLDEYDQWLHPEKALIKFAICELLMKNGISLTMKNLPGVVKANNASSVIVEKAMQKLQDAGTWDPKCDDASEALKIAFDNKNYDVCNVLICKGISLTMKNLPDLMNHYSKFRKDLYMKWKAIKHLKDTGNWDPKHDNASKALESAFLKQSFYICDLLISEAVSLTMKNLPPVMGKSLEVTKNVIQHLKETGIWYPTCSDASEALENAYRLSNCYVYDLLIHEGVLPTVKTLPWWSLESATKIVQFLKGADKWHPKCDDASLAFDTAYLKGKYDVCDLLIQEGVSPTVKTFPWWSLESATKAIQCLKGNGSWDPKSDDVSRALTNAYTAQNYDVCHLLIQEGVSLTVKSLPWWSLESVTKAILILKATGSFDPKGDDVCRALINAYNGENYNICNLLIKEGASLSMKIFSNFHCHKSIKSLKQLIQYLKAFNQWDPSSEDAKSMLASAKHSGRKDISQVLIEEGVCDPDADDSDS